MLDQIRLFEVNEQFWYKLISYYHAINLKGVVAFASTTRVKYLNKRLAVMRPYLCVLKGNKLLLKSDFEARYQSD